MCYIDYYADTAPPGPTFWFNLDGFESSMMNEGLSHAAFVAWVIDNFGYEGTVDVLQGPRRPPVQGCVEGVPF